MPLQHRIIIQLLAAVLVAVPLFAGYGGGNDSFRSGYAVLGQYGYFVATNGSSGFNLWRTDGTATRTSQVTDYSGTDAVQRVVAFRGQLLYFVDRGEVTTLATSNGRRDGSHHFFDLPRAAISHTVVREDAVYFAAGSEVWRTAGTPHETRRLHRFDWNVTDIAIAGKNIFVVASSHLWVTDGTEQGTLLLAELVGPQPIVAVPGDVILFRGRDGDLWRTDGTAQGTGMLVQGVTQNAGRAAVLDGVAYVPFFQQGYSPLIVRTDGTIEGTTRITSFDFYSIYPTVTVATNTRVIAFPGGRIWTSDGLVEPPDIVWDTPRPVLWAYAAGETVYFGHHGTIWKILVTAAGVSRVRVAWNPLAAASFTRLGDNVLFSADDGVVGREPWVIFGTPPRAGMIANLHREGTISGRVRFSGTERPRVALTSLTGNYWDSNPIDADGRFRFDDVPSGIYRVSASIHAPQYLSREWEQDIILGPGDAVTGIEIDVRPGGKVAGTITSPDGRPVAGVRVCVGPAFGACTASAFSRLDGTYETRQQVPPDVLHVVHTTDGNGYSGVIHHRVSCAAGCTSRSRGLNVQVAEGETVRVDFVVRKLGRLRGRLLDALTGELIPYAATVAAGPEQTQARGGGHFTLTLRDGTWDIRAEAVFYEPWVSPERISGVPGTLRDGYDIALTPSAGRVRGRILDARSGAPLGGTLVRVLDAAGKEVVLLSTRADGTYGSAPQLAAGRYTLVVSGKPEPIPFTITGNSIFTAPDIAVTPAP